MKNRLLVGTAVAVLGLFIAIVPVWIFPTCTKLVETASGGTMPMRCDGSGRAEIGIGLLILCGGVLLAALSARAGRIGVSLMTALTGVLSLLVPTVLIGGCGMETMACRMATFPAITVLGTLATAVCALNALYLWKSKDVGEMVHG